MDRPTDPPAPLALNGVSAGYEWNQKDRVLDAVDLELAPGSITGLLGRNGSGKTTLMRVALGLMRARTGTARLSGGVRVPDGFAPATSGASIRHAGSVWADRSALVLGLAGLAVATWYAVARALALAEIVQ